MPRKTWTAKDERKYEAILSSCKLERPRGKKRSVATCKRIAAATVNRDRKVRLRGTSEEHAVASRRFSTQARRDLIAPRSCTAAIEAHAQAVEARSEAWWTSSTTRETDNDLTLLVWAARDAIRTLCGCGEA